MKIKNIKILFLLTIFTPFFISGQNVKINEVSSSNSTTISDLDGEYPDWIELYNNSGSDINLKNFSLSDDINQLNKWRFPDILLQADSLLLLFASGKDRNETIQHWETVVREGDYCKYLLPNSNPTNYWKTIDYYDENWTTSKMGVGYGDNDDNTVVPQTVSVYLRCKFNIDDINQVSGLFFNVDYDDGFVAYINGHEIARENIGTPGSDVFYNTLADSDHEAQMYQGNLPNSYPLNDRLEVLQNGENLLAIQVHNATSSSSDLSIIPFLSLGYKSVPNISRGNLESLSLPTTKLHTNFKLNASGELLILSDENESILDSFNTRNQITDISFGRYPDGSGNFFFFNNPTPGLKNNNDGFTDFLEPPVFSVERGFHNTPFFLDIYNPNTVGKIKYTLDGSDPTENSQTYFSQLVVSKNTVIRAKVFSDSSNYPSKTITRSYFVNQEQRLPVISLSTNPEYFFDYNTGIYVLGPNAEAADPHFGANYWQDWEKPIHIELFEENNEFGFEMDLGVKIFGQYSRANPQKSLAFYARSDYGYSEIDYKLFPNSPFEKYQNFILRNSGNDWNSTMIKDALHHSIIEPLDVDKQNYRPVVVYLNGEYWGIHNLREKVNEHYIESHHFVPNNDVNMIENNFVLVNGSKDSYVEFYNSLQNMDMTTEASFEYINAKIDVKSFIDYCLLQIYIDNHDWPGNNIKFWQQSSTNSKWRWILYDTDFGFGIWNQYAYNKNTLEFALDDKGPNWPNPPWSTFLLRKFIQNDTFRNMFIARYSTYTNTLYSYKNVDKIITRLSSKISSEIISHFEKWGNNYLNWTGEIKKLRNFANYRLTYLNLYFKSRFNIQGQYNLNLTQDTTKGVISITDLPIENNSWTGNYFSEIPLEIEAVAKPKYSFSHWSGDIVSSENPLTIITSESVSISPVYISEDSPQIVINEINYNSSDTFNPDDWVELYNNSDKTIDLSGWVFKDEDVVPFFTIPQNTELIAHEYLILCRDTVLFKQNFPSVKDYMGDFGFGLSGGGELISLFNQNGVLIDSLTYDDKEPWPVKADGGGSTLELSNPFVDNSNYQNWRASAGFGTPGKINSTFTSTKNQNSSIPVEYELYQNYPNPFNPSTKIKFSIPKAGNVKLKIYDTLGREVITLFDEFKGVGTYEIEFNSVNLPTGIYFYTLTNGLHSISKKMVLVK